MFYEMILLKQVTCRYRLPTDSAGSRHYVQKYLPSWFHHIVFYQGLIISIYNMLECFKGASDFSECSFYSNDTSTLEKSWFQISVYSVKPFVGIIKIYVGIPYCVSLIITITTKN